MEFVHLFIKGSHLLYSTELVQRQKWFSYVTYICYRKVTVIISRCNIF